MIAPGVIAFFAPGEPMGKERPRFVGHAYTPARTSAAEKAIAWECRRAMRRQKPFEGPIELRIVAKFTHPESWSQKRKLTTFYKTSKPDSDNIEKLAMDALNKIAWKDDAQIVMKNFCKCYTFEKPGMWIEIKAVTK